MADPAALNAEPLRCPDCRGPMTRRFVAGIAVDDCLECRQTWYDHGELDAVLRAEFKVPHATTEYWGPRALDDYRRGCPRCGGRMRQWSFQSAPAIQLWSCKAHGVLAPFSVAPNAAISVASMQRAQQHDQRDSVARVGRVAEFVWTAKILAYIVASMIFKPKTLWWFVAVPAMEWLTSDDRFYSRERRLERQLRRSRARARAFAGYREASTGMAEQLAHAMSSEPP